MCAALLSLILILAVQISGLPVVEYQGLLSLYHELDGPNWHMSSSLPQFRPWNTSISPFRVCCSWDGVVCQCSDDRCRCDEHEIQSVVALHLKGVGLSGPFSSLNLTMFSNIFQLEIDDNPNLIAGPIPPLATWLPFPSLMETITISNTSRTGTAPAFDQLPKLISLSLSHNTIENCPSLPTNITVFDSAYNNIITCSYHVFKTTPNMTNINLDYNHITELPDLSGLSHLRSLSASSNLISEFPVFANPGSVHQISLASNRLSFALTESFFDSFQSLGEIHLNDNAIVGSVPHFYNNTKLDSINLGGNQLTGSMPSFRLPLLFRLNLSSNWLQGTIQPFTLPDEGAFSTVDVSCNHMQGPLPSWPFYPNTFVYDFYNGSDVSYCPKAVRAPTISPSVSSSSYTLSWSSAAIGGAVGAVVAAVVARLWWKRTARPAVPLSSLSSSD